MSDFIVTPRRGCAVTQINRDEIAIIGGEAKGINSLPLEDNCFILNVGKQTLRKAATFSKVEAYGRTILNSTAMPAVIGAGNTVITADYST